MDVASCRDRLDALVATFGEHRIVFGSDWPNSDGVAPLDPVVGVVREYFVTQPRAVVLIPYAPPGSSNNLFTRPASRRQRSAWRASSRVPGLVIV
jgi:hypothetical protein